MNAISAGGGGGTNTIKTIPLSKTEYNRPHKTKTDTYQDPKLFKEKLKGYTAVDDLDMVPMNCHMRYFTFNLKEHRWKFRMGGVVTFKHPKYIVLSNGRVSWSVQRKVYNDETNDVYETKFFRIMGKDEIASIALESQQKEIEELKKKNQQLQEQIEKYESYYSQTQSRSSSRNSESSRGFSILDREKSGGGQMKTEIGSHLFNMLGQMGHS